MPSDKWERGFAAGYHAAMQDSSIHDMRPTSSSSRFNPDMAKSPTKKKRKASKYNKEYAKQYAKLKKKHPRTSFAGLAKKAHKATRKVMK